MSSPHVQLQMPCFQENMNIKEKYKQKDPERQAFIKMEDLSGGYKTNHQCYHQ